LRPPPGFILMMLGEPSRGDRHKGSNEMERWQPRPALHTEVGIRVAVAIAADTATSKTQAETPAMTSQASSEKFWAKARGFLFRR
jgi:hypothetical protein